MTQAAIYLACAPKSNAVITAYGAARKDVQTFGSLEVPHKLRNARTGLAKSLGYGSGYQYPHNFSGHYVHDTYLPDSLIGHRYYEPSDEGEEQEISEKLEALRREAK